MNLYDAVIIVMEAASNQAEIDSTEAIEIVQAIEMMDECLLQSGIVSPSTGLMDDIEAVHGEDM